MTELGNATWLDTLHARLRPLVNQLSESLRMECQEYVSCGMLASRHVSLLTESLKDAVVSKVEDNQIVILNENRSAWFRAQQYFTANLRQPLPEADRPEWEWLLRGDAVLRFHEAHTQLIPHLQRYLERFPDAVPPSRSPTTRRREPDRSQMSPAPPREPDRPQMSPNSPAKLPPGLPPHAS
jgi:hypothetical protein